MVTFLEKLYQQRMPLFSGVAVRLLHTDFSSQIRGYRAAQSPGNQISLIGRLFCVRRNIFHSILFVHLHVQQPQRVRLRWPKTLLLTRAITLVQYGR